MKIYFPEYKDAFGRVDGTFCLEVLKTAPFPDDLKELGTKGIKQIWHNAKLRGRGYANAKTIIEKAEKSIGIRDGSDASKQAVKWYVNRILELDEQLSEIEQQLNQKCRKYHMQQTSLTYQGLARILFLEFSQKWVIYQDLTMLRKYRN